MSTYLKPEFLSRMEIEGPAWAKTVLELGSRDCKDAVMLAERFPGLQVYAFECSPTCLPLCEETLNAVTEDQVRSRVHLVAQAVIDQPDVKEVSFFPFDPTKYNNVGASSLYMQEWTHRPADDPDANRGCVQYEVKVPATRLDQWIEREGLSSSPPEWVCLDLQGAELSALKSMGDYLKSVRYIITESGFNTGYQGASEFGQLHEFLTAQGFEHVVNDRWGNELPQQTNHFCEFNELYRR